MTTVRAQIRKMDDAACVRSAERERNEFVLKGAPALVKDMRGEKAISQKN